MAVSDDQFAQWLEVTFGAPMRGVMSPQEIALREYWSTLSQTDKSTVFAELQKRAKSGAALGTYIDQITKSGQPPSAAPPQTPAQQQTTAANAIQGQAASAATTTSAQLPDFTTGETGAGIPVVGAAGGTIPGTTQPSGFNNLLQNYYATEFAQAGSDINQLAQLTGTTPQTLSALYQSYINGWNKVKQQVSVGQLRPGFAELGQPPMSLTEFAQQKAQSMVGPWAAVLDAISGIYQSQEGVPLPANLAQQVITALNQMPVNQQSNVLYNANLYMLNKANAIANKGLFDQTGTYATSLLQALPSTILSYTPGSGTSTGAFTANAGIVGTYMAAFPSASFQQREITAQISSDFQTKLNRAPTPADLAALGSDPTPQEITAYIDNQPAPGAPGMTFGAYSNAVTALTPMWQEYFGKDPSIAELRWSVGKSPEDLQSFINNSPSSIPGMNIGRKNDYEKFIDGLDSGTSQGHGLSAGIDESLIKDLHSQITKASTGTAAPGAM